MRCADCRTPITDGELCLGCSIDRRRDFDRWLDEQEAIADEMDEVGAR